MKDSVFGEVIYAYTREMAIADGVQVELDPATVKEAGIKFPVSVTRSVWERCIAWTPKDNKYGKYQDQNGRLWDVLWMFSQAARRRPGSEMLFSLYVVPKEGRARTPKLTTLKAVIGPMGPTDPRPCITIMERDED